MNIRYQETIFFKSYRTVCHNIHLNFRLRRFLRSIVYLKIFRRIQISNKRTFYESFTSFFSFSSHDTKSKHKYFQRWWVIRIYCVKFRRNITISKFHLNNDVFIRIRLSVKGKRGCKIRSFVVDIECACTQFYLSTTPETEERRKKTFFLFLLLFSSDSYKYSFAFDVFIESIMATNQFHAMQCKSFCRIIFFNRSFYPFLVSSLDVVRFCIRLKLNSKLTILFRKELQDYSIVLTFYFHMNIHLKQLVFLLLYYENQSVK